MLWSPGSGTLQFRWPIPARCHFGVLPAESRLSRRTGSLRLVFFNRRGFDDAGVLFHVVVSPLIYFKPSGSETK